MKKFVSLLLVLVLLLSCNTLVFGIKSITEFSPEDVLSEERLKRESEGIVEENSDSSISLLGYSDVSPTHWSYDAIMSMTEKGLFSGTTKPVNGFGTFSPDFKMTRAEFITVLTRHLRPEGMSTPLGGFVWYEPNWVMAVDLGLLSGTDFGGLDGMREPISREEMAYIIANVLSYLDENTNILINASNIPDYNEITSDYIESVLICYSAGIICGTDANGTFAPKDTVTRAQGATILYRIINSSVRLIPEIVE